MTLKMQATARPNDLTPPRDLVKPKAWQRQEVCHATDLVWPAGWNVL
eukprot:CAMPEP_0177438772 /NCGR_PEP_ID=MMETSP0369-20130122/2944_1 /TAXON_ID=447022 ORGANISM="Scrippsiella hangoei-like, Strain SHHI-4" /NCGR_SAMPLE_ID=MMETSP0369 /ASSEMBLY_ACC=CAM_ASM_000364 /LENGTH=46 /DNA_ID= /DNA_START= /DNA_END= /DNA_ORIENTATION=